MEPIICARCKKNVAVLFISKMENGKTVNEGLCMKCARELKIKPVDDMIQRLGLSEEEIDALTGEMTSAMGDIEGMMIPQDDNLDNDDDEEGKTATFPFLNRLFGGSDGPDRDNISSEGAATERVNREAREGKSKKKFLDNYCISLTERARNGELDRMIGRDEELERVIQILNRRQKNNPCLIGEPGVGENGNR